MCQIVILLKIANILGIALLQCETVKCSVRTTMDSSLLSLARLFI